MSTVVLIGLLLALLVAALIWRQHQARLRAEREREERRERTNQLLARVLLGEDRGERHTIGGPVTAIWPEVGAAAAPPSDAPADAPPPAIDLLLGDEPTTVAEQARRELERSTTLLSGLSGESTLSRPPTTGPAPALSLLESRLDVALDALVLAWFAARGYVMTPAPASSSPISLLLTHREDVERSYAFYFELGRLHESRALAVLETTRALGMNRLLIAAEHGADTEVNWARHRDVLIMDWVSLDREIRKLDFRVAAKLVAVARTRRDLLGLA